MKAINLKHEKKCPARETSISLCKRILSTLRFSGLDSIPGRAAATLRKSCGRGQEERTRVRWCLGAGIFTFPQFLLKFYDNIGAVDPVQCYDIYVTAILNLIYFIHVYIHPPPSPPTHPWTHLFHVVSCLCTGLNEHHVEFLGLALALLRGNLLRGYEVTRTTQKEDKQNMEWKTYTIPPK